MDYANQEIFFKDALLSHLVDLNMFQMDYENSLYSFISQDWIFSSILGTYFTDIILIGDKNFKNVSKGNPSHFSMGPTTPFLLYSLVTI